MGLANPFHRRAVHPRSWVCLGCSGEGPLSGAAVSARSLRLAGTSGVNTYWPQHSHLGAMLRPTSGFLRGCHSQGSGRR